MRIKFVLGDIDNSITEYKPDIDYSLSKDEIVQAYKNELEKIYNDKITVTSFALCKKKSCSYDICSLFFEYDLKYHHDIGFIYFYSDDQEIIDVYKDDFYKINNEFERKKDTLAKDVDRVYNSNKNVLIFKDTRASYISNEKLIESINYSKLKTKLYNEDFELANEISGNEAGKIILTDDRLISASLSYAMKNNKTAVVNMGDGIHPGGNVIHGGKNYEDSLCRISTLYPLLNQPYLFEDYYGKNRESNYLYLNKIIYIPKIYIFKTDELYPTPLNEDDWYKVDVITASAPNQNNIDINDDDLYEIVSKRLEQIFKVAIVNNIEVLILPAFDTGAYLNNPISCANAYKDVIEKYKCAFKCIHIAIPLKGIDRYNYRVYKKILGL